jgi:2-oxo-4-hydroxy-4-carboxy-5-ureidoimidazoline decarboxylase
MSGTLTLARLNALDQEAFASVLGFVFEHSPWVAARAWAARPFADLAALRTAMIEVLELASAAERLSLIRAHPELAGKAAIAGDLTTESRSEQAGAGLDRLTSEEFARFHQLNAAYAARFGFPFIVCVRLHDKGSILAAMARRLSNDRNAEIAEAIAQIGLIAGFRLADAVTP